MFIVRTEVNGDDPGGVTRHGAQQRGVADVVQFNVTIVRPRQQFGTVRAEAQGPDGHGVTLQRVDQLPAHQVEHVDDPVDGPRGQVD